jgi:lipopolysaccharide biosynthesis regulator YciM
VEDTVEAASLIVDESFLRAHPEAAERMCGWLERAVAREPQCTRAHFQLGVLAEEVGRREEAIEHYRRAIEIDPACLMSLTNLSILYASLGDEKGTREMVSRALALEQDGNRRKALQKLIEPFDRKTSKADERP